MKRLILAAMIASALVVPGTAATAGCTSENRGGSAGPYGVGYVAFGQITVTAEQYGNFATGPAYVCSDGTYGVEGTARGKLVITSGGEVVCATSQRFGQDPFGFGSSVHSPPGDACGADITFDGITAIFEPSPDAVHASSEGADAGVRKYTPVTGKVWFGGETVNVPPFTRGHYSIGARAQSEH